MIPDLWHKISITFTSIVLVVASYLTGQKLTPVPTPTPTPPPIVEKVEATPSAIPTTPPITKNNVKPVTTQVVQPIKDPTPAPTSVPTPLPMQATTIDSATHIELCKIEAEKTKRLTMELWVKDFNNKYPEHVELAQTSNLSDLEQVEIKYGRIKPGDLATNYTAVASTLYTVGAESKKFVGEYMDSVNYQAESVYNNAYANCLNRN